MGKTYPTMENSLLQRAAARSMGKSFVNGLSGSNRWSSLAMLEDSTISFSLEEESCQQDWLSNLPDDLLLNIVERLDTTDAGRTSILSTRWTQIPAMLSKIYLSVGSFDIERSRSKSAFGDVVRANLNMLEATRTMLESRTNQYTIHLLCMQFFLGDESVNIGQTVANAIATKKVGSVDLSLLTGKRGRKCTDDDLLTHGRQLSSFLDACSNTFSGLTRLKLENLRLGESDFHKIFSISERLEFLCLFNCVVMSLSILEVKHLEVEHLEVGHLEVEHPQLRELQILKCDFKRLDLKWLPKLTTLTCTCWESKDDPLSFGFVPLLQTLTISNTALSRHKMLKLSEFLGQLTLKELHLNFESEKIWVQPEGRRELLEVFHKLRILSLSGISEECDLNWTMFVLKGAPSLEELRIEVWDHLCEMVEDEGQRKMLVYSKAKKDACVEWKAPTSCLKHHNLSVLRIFGFQSEDKFVNYIIDVIEAAVGLKDIYLYEKPTCETCKHKKDGYPRTNKQRTVLRNIFNRETCSLARVHFPSARM